MYVRKFSIQIGVHSAPDAMFRIRIPNTKPVGVVWVVCVVGLRASLQLLVRFAFFLFLFLFCL